MNILLSLLIFSSEGLASALLCPTARELALGGAGFALSCGPEAVYLNPAALRVPGNDLLFSISYGRLFLDIEHSSLFLSRRIAKVNLGLGLVNFDYGDLTFKPDYPTEDNSTIFHANDLSLILGLSASISPKGNVGLSFKYIKEYIYVYSSSARAFNFALNFLPSQSNQISLGGFDIGNSLELRNEPYGLPMRLSLGYSNTTGKFLGGIEFHYLLRSRDWALNFGEQFTLSRHFTLRGGVRYFDGPTLTGGFGLGWSWLALDYGLAYLPKNLGFSHYFGLKRSLP